MKQMPISKLNDRLNGDMTLRRYERSDAGVRLPGRNDIRENGEPLLTLSLLRAHFYTGVFHTSYCALCEATQPTAMLVLFASLRSGQGSATLALLRSYPGELALSHDFSNHALTASLK